MENKLDVLTKKLYDEGVDKANQEAEKIINKAKEEAAKLIADAESQAEGIKNKANHDAENLKKKADAEMALSARQAVTALKQSITSLISEKVAADMAKKGFEDKAFVQELLLNIVQKWDVSSGNLDLQVILPEKEKADLEKYLASKCKNLLDKGLEVKCGDMKDGFVIQPKDSGYQIAFSEEMFETFFNQYMRNFTKSLLYN